MIPYYECSSQRRVSVLAGHCKEKSMLVERVTGFLWSDDVLEERSKDLGMCTQLRGSLQWQAIKTSGRHPGVHKWYLETFIPWL